MDPGKAGAWSTYTVKIYHSIIYSLIFYIALSAAKPYMQRIIKIDNVDHV